MANPLIVLFLLTAVTTGKDPHYKPGERHPIVAYISAETREQAEKVLPERLAEQGWKDWHVLKSGLADPGSQEEGVKSARENGSSITIFSEATTFK
jgi:hypothetical protein